MLQDYPNVASFLSELETALADNETSDGIETGFRDSPPSGDSMYLFLNRTEFDYGHLLDDDGNPIRPPGRYVTGRLTDVEYFTRVNDYGTSHKLRLPFETDGQNVVVEAGFYANTGKSLLSDLASVQDPNSILTIEPNLPDERRGGNSQNVLFTDLYEGSDKIYSERAHPQTDQDVIDLFQEVRQDVFGLGPSDEQPQPQNGGGQGGGAPQQGAPRQQQQPQQRRQGGQQQNGQRQQRQPQQNGQPQQGGQPRQNGGRQPAAGNGQPQQAPQQGGGQQPNQAPPSRNDTAQTPSTPPPTTI